MNTQYPGRPGNAFAATPCALRFGRLSLERTALQGILRLKLRRPGPKALRSPEHMDGVPGLSPAEQAKVDASAEIHRRSREMLSSRPRRPRAAALSHVTVAKRQHRHASRMGSALQPCRSMFTWHGHLQKLGTLCFVPEHSVARKHMQ